MTIIIQNTTYDLTDFLFKKPDLKEYNVTNQYSIDFLNEWISGKKEFIVKSSGTTGEPKAIVLKRKWLELSALQTISLLNLWEERVLCCVPIYKIGGLMMIVRSLAGGFDLEIVEPSADPMLELKENHSFTFISLVPYQLIKILSNPTSKLKLNRFKIVLLGGSEITTGIVKELESLTPQVYHTYGMTETCSHIALKKLNHGSWEHFVPNPGVELLVDSDGKLSIKALQTGGNLIETSDSVKIYSDGTFDFLGRKDFVINSGGFKIWPEHLEHKIYAILNANEHLADLALSSIKHTEWGEELVLILTNKHFCDNDGFLKLLKEHLEKFEIPKKVMYMETFPLNEGGKLDRYKLKQMVLTAFNTV